MSSEETSATTWNTDTTYALGLYRILTRALGIWPPDGYNYISTIKVTIFSVLQLAMVVVHINDLITKDYCSVIADIVEVFTVIVTSIPSIMKIIFPYIYQKNMHSIIKSAVKDWNNVVDKKSYDIMLKYAYIGRIVFIVQMIGAYITILLSIFSNLPSFTNSPHESNENLSSFRNIPTGPSCWISPTMPTYLYYVYYFLHASHLLILCTAYNGGDVYIFGIAMHVCGQFELLYNNMEKLDGNENSLNLREKVTRLSERHCHLLQLASEFEKSFNIVILVQVAANTFVIGISGILVLWSLEANDNELAISLSIRIYILYVELYLYSYIGEHLAEQAGKLQVAIYNCSWYNMPPSFVRDLSFIMMRNNYPFHLTAGKIYNMNIANYKNLVRTMFSYFSVIRIMLEDK